MLALSGTMQTDVKLLSTPLELKKGQRVLLTFPDNQPNPHGKWFAQPLDGIWPDGVERSNEDSILLDIGDAVPDAPSIASLKEIVGLAIDHEIFQDEQPAEDFFDALEELMK